MASRNLLFSKLWLTRSGRGSEELSRRFFSHGGVVLGDFLDALIFDEKIFFPTSSYSEIGFLLQALGSRNIFGLLETGRLRFVFVPGSFGANGRQLLQISKVNEDTKETESSWSEFGAAIENFTSLLPRDVGRSALRDLLLDSSHTYQLQTEWNDLRDVSQQEFERSMLRVGRGGVLKKVGWQFSNQISVFDGFLKMYPSLASASIEEIRQFQLAYFHGNVEARIAEEVSAVDLVSSTLSAPQLFEKSQIALESSDHQKQILEFREIAQLPIIGQRVVRGEIPLAGFFEFVSSRDAKSFREWFADNADLGAEVRKSFIDLLQRNAIEPNTFAKSKRFALELVMSIVPGASLVESAYSKFISPITSRDKRVLLFLDRYKKGMFSSPARKKLEITKYL